MYYQELFTTLGITPTNDPKVIKKAWRKKAHQHHPDKGGDAKEFNKAKDAYERIIASASFAFSMAEQEGEQVEPMGVKSRSMKIPENAHPDDHVFFTDFAFSFEENVFDVNNP